MRLRLRQLAVVAAAFAAGVLAVPVHAQTVFDGDPIDTLTGRPLPMMPGLPLMLPGSDDDWNTADDRFDFSFTGDTDLVVRIGTMASGPIAAPAGVPGGAAELTTVAGGGGTGQGAETAFTLAVSDGSGAGGYGNVIADATMDGRPAIVFAHADLDGDGRIGPNADDGSADGSVELQEAHAYVGRQVGRIQGGVLAGSVGVHVAAPASMGGLRVVLSAAAYTGSSAAVLYTDGPPILTLWPYFPPLDPKRVLGGGSPPLPDPDLGSEVNFDMARNLLPAADHPTLGGLFSVPVDGSEPSTDHFVVVSGPMMGARLFDEIAPSSFVPSMRVAIRPAPGVGGGGRVMVLPISHVLLANDGVVSMRTMRLLAVDLFGNVADPPNGGTTVRLAASGSVRIVSPDADGDPFSEDVALVDAAGATVVIDDAGAGQGWLEVVEDGLVVGTTFVNVGALADSDGDGIPDDGDGSGVLGDRPCTAADVIAGTPCDDNCPFLVNPRQVDHNTDGLGDCCDGSCAFDPSGTGCGECSSGLCGGGLPTGCDDGDACTADQCDPAVGCVHDPIDCSDGDVCTNNVCDAQLGCVAAPVVCEDGDPCTIDSCGPGLGCTSEPLVCDDGDPCTVDSCDATAGCTAAAIDCDDRDACTIDGCSDGLCTHTPDAAAGSACVVPTTTTTTSTTTLPPSSIACGTRPAVGCFAASENRARLQIKRSLDVRRTQLRWLWRRGEATTMADLFDPMTAGADYAVCMYDARKVDGPVYEASISGGGNCGRRPCWQPIGSDAVKYLDGQGSAGGVAMLKVTSGPAGRSKLLLTARGANLLLPDAPVTVPVTIQVLAGDGSATSCWQTTYAAAKRNTDGLFLAVGP